MKKNKLFLFIIFVSIASSAFSATFNWSPTPPTIINLTEGQTFYYNTNVTVNESSITFNYLKTVEDPDLNGTFKNIENGEFSFSPSNQDSINYFKKYFYMQIIAKNASDPINDKINHDFYFLIQNTNNDPIINSTIPIGNTVFINETQNYTFSISFYDPDPTNNSLTVDWYINNSLVQTNSYIPGYNIEQTDTYTFNSNYSSAGKHIIKVILYDNESSNNITKSWNLSVSNVDRIQSFFSITPNYLNVTINESMNQSFSISINDPDNDNINSYWYINGLPTLNVFNSNNSNYTFSSNYLSARNYNISVIASTSYNNISNWWNLTVLNVNQAPNITTISFPLIINEGELINISFNASDIDNNIANYSIYENDKLISSNQFYNSISNFTSSGTHNYTLFVNDSLGLNDTENISIVILDNVAPQITTFNNLTNGLEGNSYNFNFSSNDSNSNIFNNYIIHNGNIISVSNSTNISFNFSTSGIHNITYFVNDTQGLNDSITLLLNISNVNQAPNITSKQYQTSINEGETINLSFINYDYDNNIDSTIIYRNSKIISTNGSFSSISNFSSSGNYSYQFFVNDTENLSDTFNFTLNIIDNIAPTIPTYINTSSINEGTFFNFSFTTQDSNSNINSKLIKINGLVISSNNFTSKYFNETSSGNYTLEYFVNDTQGLNSSINFNFTVNQINFPPSITNIINNSPINEGENLNIYFNATDIDNNIANFSVYLNNTLIGSSNNISWTSNFSSSGIYNITLFVNDTQGLNDTYSFPIEIIDNIPPQITTFINLTNGSEQNNLFFGFNANDSNSNLDIFIIYLDGTIQAFSNQSFIYFNSNSSGIHNITYFVNDTQGLSNSQSIFINISNTNEAPVIYSIINNSPINEGENLNISFFASDIDNNIDTYNIYLNGSLKSQNSSLFLNTNFTSAGIYNVSLFVNDTQGLNNTYSFLIEILDNLPPQIISFTNLTSGLEGNTYIFNFSSNDSNSNLITQNIYMDGFLLNNSNISSIYFNFTSNGIHNITYKAIDSEGLSDNISTFINISNVNAIPKINFSSIQNLIVVEDLNRTLNLNNYSYDEDNLNSELNWTCNSSLNINEFTIFINETTNILYLQALNSFVGIGNISCTVFDLNHANTSNSFMVNITEGNNDPPIILNISPTNNQIINFSEDNIFNFSIIAMDIENTTMNYSWNFKSVTVDNKSNASIYFDYYSSGLNNLTVTVTDSGGASSNISWQLNISDKNRIPKYGPILDEFNTSSFNLGITNNTYKNLTSKQITLLKNGTNYYTQGNFLSNVISFPIIDFKLSPNWNETILNQTNISYFIRSGPTVTYSSAWSDFEKLNSNNYSSFYNINSGNYQYKFILSTSNISKSPIINNFTFKKYIGDKSWNRGTNIINWIDLNDFFYDLDSDNTLYFNVSGNSQIDVFIDNISNKVSLYPNNNFYGTEIINFIAFDGKNNISSGNISLTVNNIVNNPTPDTTHSNSNGGSSSSSSSSSKKIKYIKKVINKTIKAPYSGISFIKPKQIKGDENLTIQVPVTFKNPFNFTINNVSLFINSSNKNITIPKSILFLTSLGPGEEKKFIVNTSNPDKIKNFMLEISAYNKLYGHFDSGNLYIEPLITPKDNLTKVFNNALEFFEKNLECIEFTEQVKTAKKLLNKGENQKAKLLITKSVDGCRRLILSKTNISKSSVLSLSNKNKKQTNIYLIITLGVILTLILISILGLTNNYLKIKKIKKNKVDSDDINDFLNKLN